MGVSVSIYLVGTSLYNDATSPAPPCLKYLDAPIPHPRFPSNACHQPSHRAREGPARPHHWPDRGSQRESASSTRMAALANGPRPKGTAPKLRRGELPSMRRMTLPRARLTGRVSLSPIAHISMTAL
jgi:hypothetical protein